VLLVPFVYFLDVAISWAIQLLFKMGLKAPL
jgi:hypothetical protein